MSAPTANSSPPAAAGPIPAVDARTPDPRAGAEFQRGLAFAQTMDWANTAASFERAATLDPSNATYWFALGNSLFQLRRYPDSVRAYFAGLQRKPAFAPAHVQLGNVFKSVCMHEEARQCFETALLLGGERAKLLSAMAHQSQQACRWDWFAQDHAALSAELADGGRGAVPFQVVTAPSTRQQQRIAAQEFWARNWGTIRPLPVPPPRRPGSPIRIGYVTNDIYRHATAYLIAEVFERHDRDRFEVFLYSYGPDDGSDIRRRILDAVGDRFRDITGIPDRDAAERIRGDEIDILLDLKGYALDPRSGIFAHRPARIQANYLGYPGTLGASCHDYIIGDPIVTPADHADGYDEAIAQLPDCYQANDRQREIGPRPDRQSCGLPESGFVFGSFNSSYKITAEMFDRWCRMLRQVDGSVLWLYDANAEAKRNLTAEAGKRGVGAARLVWAPHLSLEAHLGRIQLADLILDTFPVTAHTTASDALWAGVPLITICGDTFVSRVAASVLRAAGLPELIASQPQEYEHLAIDLARDRERRLAIRARLAAARQSCPLFDTPRYVRNLESLFTEMVARDERGLPPAPMTVRPMAP